MKCWMIKEGRTFECSRAYLEIYNLIEVVKNHKLSCTGADCNIMLFILREVAVQRILPHVWAQESKAAIEMIEGVEW